MHVLALLALSTASLATAAPPAVFSAAASGSFDSPPDHVAILKFLIARGADVNARSPGFRGDSSSRLPADVALDAHDPKALRLLKDSGADLSKIAPDKLEYLRSECGSLDGCESGDCAAEDRKTCDTLLQVVKTPKAR